MPLRLIEVLCAPLGERVVVQHAVELCPFERVEQRLVGCKIVRKFLPRMYFASHSSVGVICEGEIIELDGRIGRSCGRSSSEIHSPRIVLASNRGGDMNIHRQLSIGDWDDDSRQCKGVAALRQIGKRSGERGKSETICGVWRGRLPLHRCSHGTLRWRWLAVGCGILSFCSAPCAFDRKRSLASHRRHRLSRKRAGQGSRRRCRLPAHAVLPVNPNAHHHR